MTEDERAVIAQVLCSQALADHLGDMRDAELDLWKLLSVARPLRDSDHAFENTQLTLKQAGIPLPSYLGTHEEVERQRVEEQTWEV